MEVALFGGKTEMVSKIICVDTRMCCVYDNLMYIYFDVIEMYRIMIDLRSHIIVIGK